MPKVKFLPSGVVCEVKAGESILDIALSHGVPIQHACGGFCACTTCHCEIIEGATNLEAPDSDEQERLNVLDDPTPTSRLGCQAKVKGDVVVRVVNEE
jgi:2Fe-2S ferredoxin